MRIIGLDIHRTFAEVMFLEDGELIHGVRFVASLLEGKRMAPLCRSFGISRKTGCKIYNWYRKEGVEPGPRPFECEPDNDTTYRVSHPSGAGL